MSQQKSNVLAIAIDSLIVNDVYSLTCSRDGLGQDSYLYQKGTVDWQPILIIQPASQYPAIGVFDAVASGNSGHQIYGVFEWDKPSVR